MEYKTRNLIILGTIFLIVTLTGSYFMLWSYPNKIDTVQGELDDVLRKIKALEGIESEFAMLDELLKEKESRLSNIDKQIVPTITTANVYDYLNQILNYSGIIEFNLSTKDHQEFGTYGYNSYNLQGEAKFRQIYNFIWYLEHGPHVYEIVSLKVSGLERRDEKSERLELVLPFEMEIRAYFAGVEELETNAKSLEDVKVVQAKNPFYPFILRNLPPNSDNLLEVESAKLKAIIPGKALIADGNNEIHVLREGDRVYLGYLTRIDTENNRVEFTLNKGGIIEKFVLNMEFEEKSNKK